MAEMADEEEDLTLEEIQDLFVAATDYVKGIKGLSDERKLAFYGYFKQAREGPCNSSRPGFWDMVGRAKWDAWKRLGDMSPEEAMEGYIQQLYELDPEWEGKQAALDTSADEKPPPRSQMGVAVSTMKYTEEEEISDSKKTVFDWCKEGEVKQMTDVLKKDSVNNKDDQGLTLLHWACDRGHEDVVEYLIKYGADVNIQDEDGQTPLHYAATCEFVPVVKLLLQAGADPAITDSDDCLPLATTDCAEIKQLLQSRST